MTVYPVVFTYEELVKGRGFLAGVLARGRALMVHEDGEWWMYGVQPGVLAEGGDTFEESRLLFRQTFREILFDLAEGAKDFESFKVTTEKTLGEINGPMVERWLMAVETIRANPAVIEDPVQKLPRVAANEPVMFEVVQIAQPAHSTADNRADQYQLAEAA